MSRPLTNAATFAHATDQEIIAQATTILRRRDPNTLAPGCRRLLRARKPDVQVAGKFLWAHLCGWKGAA